VDNAILTVAHDKHDNPVIAVTDLAYVVTLA
jgi:hypothetical protein